MFKTKWFVWNVDRACPVGAPLRSLRKAIACATVLECRDGEHHTVVPA